MYLSKITMSISHQKGTTASLKEISIFPPSHLYMFHICERKSIYFLICWPIISKKKSTMSTLIVFLTQKWNGKDDSFAYLLIFFPKYVFCVWLCLFVFYVHFCFVYRFASLADRRRLLLQSHKEHASFQSDFSAKSTVSRCVHKFYQVRDIKYKYRVSMFKMLPIVTASKVIAVWLVIISDFT